MYTMDQDIEPETPNRYTSISVLEFQRDVWPLYWYFARVLTFGPLDNGMVWKNGYIITSLIKHTKRDNFTQQKKIKKYEHTHETSWINSWINYEHKCLNLQTRCFDPFVVVFCRSLHVCCLSLEKE